MEVRNFIGGKFVDSISKSNIPVINPANQNVVGHIDEALDDEIDLALLAAKNSFNQRILQDMDTNKKANYLILVLTFVFFIKYLNK